MKHINVFYAILLSLTILFQISCSSSKTTAGEEKTAQLKQQIESRNYRISVNYMLPSQGVSRSLTSPYSLTVQGDSLISYLPYIGRAYSVPYGGGNGLNFTAPLFDYSLSFNSKETASILFRARSEGDVILYNIEIYSNRKATIRVTSNNRQGISFYGEIEEKTPIIPKNN